MMPIVTVQGKTFNCKYGANLRKVLLEHNINLHNGKSNIINCRGIGSCGTCAVEIIGEVSPANWKDRVRRSLPPHSLEQNRRLACHRLLRRETTEPAVTVGQTKVLGDLKVVKYNGFWGQGNSVISNQ